MADNTSIEWCRSPDGTKGATWNPITGCTLVSEGCRHCYAARLAATRLKHLPSRKGLARINAAGEAKFTGEVRFNEEWLDQPLRWKRPRMVFVCAHGDLFHESVPDAWIDRIFAVMALAPQHTFQVLSKRSKRMREFLSDARTVRRIYETVCDRVIHDQLPAVLLAAGIADPGLMPAWPRVRLDTWPLPNVWLGVSAEDQATADERIPDLLATPAAIRFVSAEPLLGPTNLRSIDLDGDYEVLPLGAGWLDRLEPGEQEGPRLDQIIVGGESGEHARPMHPDWARAIRDQCAAAGTAFFFKQWGSHRPLTRAERGQACGATLIGEDPHDPDAYVLRVGKKKAGRLLDGVEHNGMPEARP